MALLKTLLHKPFWSYVDTIALGRESEAGIKISNSSALTSIPYFSGVNLISQTLAQVPLILYKRLSPRGKERGYQHQLYRILHEEPNEFMSAFTFKETLQGHLLTWGNAYAEIDWEPRQKIVRALYPLRPDRMQVVWEDGKIVYKYALPGDTGGKLPAWRILHIPGFGFDGLVGYDPITLAREAIGLSKATEKFGARFFKRGSALNGVITHPGRLSQKANENMRKSWEELHSGLDNQHRVAILEEGVTYKDIGIPPDNAQFLETRKFQVSEIARFLRVPPHMIGDLEKATFSNIEHQGIEYVVYTMSPWFTRWEQGINRKCLSPADRLEYFSEFLAEGLLRGDSQARASFYKELFQMASISPNDIREKENMNPYEGGDIYVLPLNMEPIMPGESSNDDINQVKINKARAEIRARKNAQMRYNAARSFMKVFRAMGQKIVDKEIRDIIKNARKHLGSGDKEGWESWLNQYYPQFRQYAGKEINGPAKSLTDAIRPLALEEINSRDEINLEKFINEYSETYARRHAESSVGQLKAITRDESLEGGDPLVAVEKRTGEWA
jgi:HK97 family phage portal protein